MLDKLPIKKTHLLLIASILLLLVGYQLAFKNTIGAWHLHRQLTAQLKQQSSLDYQPGYNARKNRNLDHIISAFKTDTSLFRERAVSKISGIADNLHVKVISLPGEDPYYHTPQTIVQRIDLEGDYFALIKLQRQIEQMKGMGILHSVEIKTGINKQVTDKRVKKLTMFIWLGITK